MKLITLFLCLCATTAHAAGTIDQIRAAGQLTCGVVVEAQDWNKDDLHGNLAALDGEICRAAATAVLGDHEKVIYKEYPVEIDAEQALAKGEIEMIAGVSPSATATMLHHIWFSPAFFYDDATVLALKASNIATLSDLAHKKVCTEDGTDLERLVQARLVDRGIAAIPFPFQEEGEMDDALVGGHCDAIFAERSKLAQTLATYAARADELELLPNSVTLDPVAAATRQDDPRWTAVVAWTINALIQAEATGVTRANVHEFNPGDDPVSARLLGTDWATAQAFDLPRDWTVQVLSAVGNYGEIFERTVGRESSYHLPRGLNALWLSGGLIAPMPVR